MGLLEILVLGSYAWTTLVARWLYKQIHNHIGTHLHELEVRVASVENRVDPRDHEE